MTSKPRTSGTGRAWKRTPGTNQCERLCELVRAETVDDCDAALRRNAHRSSGQAPLERKEAGGRQQSDGMSGQRQRGTARIEPTAGSGRDSSRENSVHVIALDPAFALDLVFAFDDRPRAARTRRRPARQHAPHRDGESEAEDQNDGDPPRHEERDEACRNQADREDHARNGFEDFGDPGHGKRREARPTPYPISPAVSRNASGVTMRNGPARRARSRSARSRVTRNPARAASAASRNF